MGTKIATYKKFFASNVVEKPLGEILCVLSNISMIYESCFGKFSQIRKNVTLETSNVTVNGGYVLARIL